MASPGSLSRKSVVCLGRSAGKQSLDNASLLSREIPSKNLAWSNIRWMFIFEPLSCQTLLENFTILNFLDSHQYYI
jgi:hypothetical protein